MMPGCDGDADQPRGRPAGWSTAAPGPLRAELGAVATWTGTEVLVVGGWDTINYFDDAAAFDPRTGKWRRVAAIPFGGMSYQSQVWTGKELLVWGLLVSRDGYSQSTALGYDPERDRWRRLPPAPMPAVKGAGVVWTGKEMIVWGGEGLTFPDPGVPWGDLYADGAAYDPATDTWRRLPDAPLEPRVGHTTTWTGTELIIWGGCVADERRAFSNGASYNSQTDQWTVLPAAPVNRRCHASSAWTGTELMIFGGMSFNDVHPERSGAAYRPAERTWHTLPDLPSGVSGTQSFWNGSALLCVTMGPETMLTYTPATATWERVPGRHFQVGSAAWTGAELVVYGQTEDGSRGTRIWRP